MSTFLELTFRGFALGCVYALVALGFTAIYRATKVINFAQGSLLLLGAYLVSWFSVDHGLPFGLAVLLALAACVLCGVLFQTVVLRRVTGQPVFTVVMLTIGLNVVISAGVPAAFGSNQRPLGDPLGNSTVTLGDVALGWFQIWAIMVTAVVLALFFAFNRYSRYGLAMRAASADEEAARAVGIPVRRVNALAWGIAGGVAVIGGIFLAGYAFSVDPSTGDAALRAFPAIILGGLESYAGAVLGGIVIGLVEVLTAGYQPDHAAWLGHNFYAIAPYVVMIMVLLVRPYGIFGERPVERV